MIQPPRVGEMEFINLFRKILKKIFIKIIIITCFVLINSMAYAKTTILISIVGVSNNELQRLPYVNALADSGVNAFSLKPVFPTQTLPNIASILTGMLPNQHGISANSFINTKTNEVFNLKDYSKYDSKWINSQLLWKDLSQNNINTVSVDYPLSSNEFSSLVDITLSKDNPKLITILDSIVNNNDNNFIAVYFDEIDYAGHKFGKSSSEYNDAFLNTDSKIKKIAQILNNQKDANIIVHSTFGAIEYNYEKFIHLLGLFTVPAKEVKHINMGAFCMIYDNDKDIMNFDESDYNDMCYDIYTEIPAHIDPFTENNRPNYFIVAKPPFMISPTPENMIDALYTAHGYETEYEMHGFFAAYGTQIHKHQQTAPVDITYIYHLIKYLFDIPENKHANNPYLILNFHSLENYFQLNIDTDEK